MPYFRNADLCRPLIRSDLTGGDLQTTPHAGALPLTWTLEPIVDHSLQATLTGVNNVAANFYNQPFFSSDELSCLPETESSMTERQVWRDRDNYRLLYAQQQILARLSLENQRLATRLIENNHFQPELTCGLAFLAAWRHCQPELLEQSTKQYLLAYTSDNVKKMTLKIGNVWLCLLSEKMADKTTSALLKQVVEIGERIRNVVKFAHFQGVKEDPKLVLEYRCYYSEYQKKRFQLEDETIPPPQHCLSWDMKGKIKYDAKSIERIGNFLLAAYSCPFTRLELK